MARYAARAYGGISQDVSYLWDGSHRSLPNLKGFWSRTILGGENEGDLGDVDLGRQWTMGEWF